MSPFRSLKRSPLYRSLFSLEAIEPWACPDIVFWTCYDGTIVGGTVIGVGVSLGAVILGVASRIYLGANLIGVVFLEAFDGIIIGLDS